MNDFGEFLCSLRKEKNMTQAALAEALGVTNKAVSKWETGEAMPETSLLVPLSNIFGVTVDELLNGRRNAATATVTEKKCDSPADHLFTRGKDDPESVWDRVCGIVCAVVALGGIAAYLFVGAFTGMWHPYWIIAVSCALGCGIIGIIFSLCDRDKRRLSMEHGKNPYTDAACGLIMLCCIIAYLLCGALGSLWHPHWTILIAGAAVSGTVGTVGNVFASKRK